MTGNQEPSGRRARDEGLYLPGSPANGLRPDHAQAVLEQRDRDRKKQSPPSPSAQRQGGGKRSQRRRNRSGRSAHDQNRRDGRNEKGSRSRRMRNIIVSMQIVQLFAVLGAVLALWAAFQFGWIGM
jgi:hypothetical protein